MRVALISTCSLPTPPSTYGGTERVVAELARGLIELGHEVTVYATGDSRPPGSLRWLYPHAAWPPSDAAERRHALFAFSDLRRSGGVDVVHVHDTTALESHQLIDAPCVLTLHHAREEAMVSTCRAHPEVALVAISRRQAELIPELNVTRVIHHGFDVERYRLGRGDGGYVAFLGRFTPEKAPHLAIEAAIRAGVPIQLGGGPQERARAYFEQQVIPLLARNRGSTRWPGELDELHKIELLRDAKALLFPIDWEEPFGLVLIEAMLIGTPVIAFPHGSVREVVDESITGFVVNSVDEMAARIRSLDGFDRARCRAHAQKRWSHRRMAREHVALYEQLITTRRVPVLGGRPSIVSAPPH